MLGPMPLRDLSDILNLIESDPWRMAALRAARAQGLPDWWIGAGFVRAAVWDHLHGFPASALADVDVLYFDQSDLREAVEKRIEAALRAEIATVPWSVKNQARMHLRNGDPPYASSEDALLHWLETPTAVAVSLDADNRLALIAPFGIDDLLNLRIRPTASGRQRRDEFEARVAGKNWLEQWPMARVVD